LNTARTELIQLQKEEERERSEGADREDHVGRLPLAAQLARSRPMTYHSGPVGYRAQDGPPIELVPTGRPVRQLLA
jgi:hypothetical protein